MTNRTLIGNLHDSIGQQVVVQGWIDIRRDHGKLVFLDIRDRTGIVQAVALPNHEGVVPAAQTLRPEYVVSVTATVNKRPERMINADQPNGDIELELVAIEVLAAASELPFEKDTEVNLDTLFDYRPLTLRRAREQAVFTVQSEILKVYRSFLIAHGFTEIQPPKIVGDDAEGGGNIFRLEYFKDKYAYLATSPQLYKQIMVGVFERVFMTGNVFRAEKHATSRHLNEYTSIDIEMGFIKDHTDIIALEMELMRALVAHLRETSSTAFTTVGATLPLVPEGAFPQMKLREAQALIKEKTGKDKTNQPDLEPEDERWLCEYAHDELGSDFIFITHYPTSKRPFYTYDDPDDPGFTKSFDLLFRGVEITTGGQRIHEYDMLVEKTKVKGLEPKNFEFYYQCFKYGMPPHGGWGMGLERLTQKMLGLENVKEATLFPRDMNRIDTRLAE